MGLWKKITGIEKLEREKREREEELARLEAEQIEAEKAAEERRKLAEEEEAQRREEERLAKLTPKERATQKGEPWIEVLDTHVEPNDMTNGFFEMDWNRQFVDDLIKAGYGTEADPEEEIVDRWFRDIVARMLVDEGQDPTRGAGYINVSNLGSGRSEVS